MKKQSWLMLVVAVILALTLAACSSKTNEPNNTGGSSSNQQQTGNNQSGNGESLDKVTFTLFNAGASRKDVLTSDTMIGKIHEENTGVSFQIEHLVGEIQTKIGTMIAGGNYPDVIVPDTEIDNIVDNDAFIALNDLIENHAPNIKRVYGPYLNTMKAEDGNIYFLPFGPQVGEFIANPTIDQGAFWMQSRVLKEFNYPKLTTLDDYFDLIRQYAAKYPDEDLIGFTTLTDDWRFFATSNPPNHLAGYPNDGGVIIDMDTLEATDYSTMDYTKRWLKALNELDEEGLFDRTSFINTYEQYLAKLTSGNVLGFFDYGWQVNQALSNLRNAGNPDLEYFPMPIVFDPGIKDQYLDPPAFVNNRGIGITTSASDPVRIIQFFDYLLTDEIQILNQWGIEGETYEIDDQGKFYRTPEQIEKLRDNIYKQDVGLTYFEYYWPMYSQDSTLANGNAHAAGRQGVVALLSFTDSEREYLEHYGVNTFSELFAYPDDRPWYPAWSVPIEQGSPAQIYQQRKDDLLKLHFPILVFADPGEFEAKWQEYLDAFSKLDVAGYEATMTRLVKEKVESMQ